MKDYHARRSNYYDRLAAEYDDAYLGTGLWSGLRRKASEEELRALGDAISGVSAVRVLDVACGTGFLTRHLRGEVVGLDLSEAMLEIARQRVPEATFVNGDAFSLPFPDDSFDRVFASNFYGLPLGVAYRVADAARMDMLEDGTFEVVMPNMALMDLPDAEGVLRETARVLSEDGRLVASLPHPCFAVGASRSGWVVEEFDPETTVWRKVSRYREVFQHSIIWRDESVGEWYTSGYHRPLSWYFRALRRAGFVVSTFEEPEPTKEFLAEEPRGPWIEQILLHVVIEAFKTDRLTPP